MRFLICFVVSLVVSLVVDSQEKITLLFAGDLMQHQEQIDAAKTANGYDYSDCFKFVKEEIKKADIAIGNLEVTMGGRPYKGYPAFSAPDEYLSAIKNAGFNVLITANNHCLDTGKRGLERTVKMLDSLDISHAGTYLDSTDRKNRYPLLIEKNGFRIVLLNYTYGTNGIKVVSPTIVNYTDKSMMSRDIREARAMHPDVIIACIHWGVEYKQLPGKEQKELADWLISQGVNHVIGSHPHVVQPLELRSDMNSVSKNVVVYSLGNYISNMSARNTDGGIMFKLVLRKFNRIVRIIDCGYSLVWTSRPAISGKKNYLLYPAANPPEILTPAEANRLKIFVDGSRKLFKEYNEGISEYIF